MQVLVTGANGFIGRALCTRLLVEGWHVRGSVKSKKHLATLPAEVETVQVESIGLDTDWSRVLPGIDVIVHLAARAHVMNNNVGDPLAAFREDGTPVLQHTTYAAAHRRTLREVGDQRERGGRLGWDESQLMGRELTSDCAAF